MRPGGLTQFQDRVKVRRGGSLGFAGRFASLAATDACIPAITCFAFPVTSSSAVSLNATTMAFLANGEASLSMRPLPHVTIRAFAGLDYDARVPGISAPTFVTLTTLLPAQGTPAAIKFQAETSYYAGGGVTVKFAP